VRDEIVIVDRSRNIVATLPVGQNAGGGSADRGTARSQESGEGLTLRPDEIRQIQVVLKQKGLYSGDPDGVMGPQTTQALIAFQRQQGFEASGRIDSRTVTALGVSTQSGQQDSQGTAQAPSAPNPGTAGQSGTTQNPGTAQQRNQSGEQPATERGGERVPANRNTTGQQGGQQGNEQPSTTGGNNNRTEQAPPPADRKGDTGTRESPANRRNPESAR
jgi:peptidoglycan hydrolase-like protein with peptidoglycan-binding domain